MKKLMVLTVMLMAAPTWADVAVMSGTRVVRTLLADDERWGGCMVELDRPVASTGLDCPHNWVTFSCTGDFGPKDSAYKRLELAQMAQALQLRVLVVVDDGLKHNGYCYANRIDAY